MRVAIFEFDGVVYMTNARQRPVGTSAVVAKLPSGLEDEYALLPVVSALEGLERFEATGVQTTGCKIAYRLLGTEPIPCIGYGFMNFLEKVGCYSTTVK
jgi:hypothetical protein